MEASDSEDSSSDSSSESEVEGHAPPPPPPPRGHPPAPEDQEEDPPPPPPPPLEAEPPPLEAEPIPLEAKPEADTLYNLLKADPCAELKEVKRKLKNLTCVHHQDRQGVVTAFMQQLRKAKDVFASPETREKYDSEVMSEVALGLRPIDNHYLKVLEGLMTRSLADCSGAAWAADRESSWQQYREDLRTAIGRSRAHQVEVARRHGRLPGRNSLILILSNEALAKRTDARFRKRWQNLMEMAARMLPAVRSLPDRLDFEGLRQAIGVVDTFQSDFMDWTGRVLFPTAEELLGRERLPEPLLEWPCYKFAYELQKMAKYEELAAVLQATARTPDVEISKAQVVALLGDTPQPVILNQLRALRDACDRGQAYYQELVPVNLKLLSSLAVHQLLRDGVSIEERRAFYQGLSEVAASPCYQAVDPAGHFSMLVRVQERQGEVELAAEQAALLAAQEAAGFAPTHLSEPPQGRDHLRVLPPFVAALEAPPALPADPPGTVSATPAEVPNHTQSAATASASVAEPPVQAAPSPPATPGPPPKAPATPLPAAAAVATPGPPPEAPAAPLPAPAAGATPGPSPLPAAATPAPPPAASVPAKTAPATPANPRVPVAPAPPARPAAPAASAATAQPNVVVTAARTAKQPNHAKAGPGQVPAAAKANAAKAQGVAPPALKACTPVAPTAQGKPPPRATAPAELPATAPKVVPPPKATAPPPLRCLYTTNADGSLAALRFHQERQELVYTGGAAEVDVGDNGARVLVAPTSCLLAIGPDSHGSKLQLLCLELDGKRLVSSRAAEEAAAQARTTKWKCVASDALACLFIQEQAPLSLDTIHQAAEQLQCRLDPTVKRRLFRLQPHGSRPPAAVPPGPPQEGTISASAESKYFVCVSPVAITAAANLSRGKALRKLEVGEVLQLEEGPVEDEELNITRLKGKLLRDGQVGWVTVKGTAGTVYIEAREKHQVAKRLSSQSAPARPPLEPPRRGVDGEASSSSRDAPRLLLPSHPPVESDGWASWESSRTRSRSRGSMHEPESPLYAASDRRENNHHRPVRPPPSDEERFINTLPSESHVRGRWSPRDFFTELAKSHDERDIDLYFMIVNLWKVSDPGGRREIQDALKAAAEGWARGRWINKERAWLRAEVQHIEKRVEAKRRRRE